MNMIVIRRLSCFLLLSFTLLSFVSCSDEKERLPGNENSSGTVDSLKTDSAVVSANAVSPADTISPESKILPVSDYLAASKELLKWAGSETILKELKKEVKIQNQITAFLENHISAIVRKYGFANRINYLTNENFYEKNKDVRKIAQEIQDAFDRTLTPYISDSILTDQQKKIKQDLLVKLEKALGLMQSSRFEELVFGELKKNNNDQAGYDRINEQIFVESGFSSYKEALTLINTYRSDPNVQHYILEMNKTANELMKKHSK